MKTGVITNVSSRKMFSIVQQKKTCNVAIRRAKLEKNARKNFRMPPILLPGRHKKWTGYKTSQRRKFNRPTSKKFRENLNGNAEYEAEFEKGLGREKKDVG